MLIPNDPMSTAAFSNTVPALAPTIHRAAEWAGYSVPFFVLGAAGACLLAPAGPRGLATALLGGVFKPMATRRRRRARPDGYPRGREGEATSAVPENHDASDCTASGDRAACAPSQPVEPEPASKPMPMPDTAAPTSTPRVFSRKCKMDLAATRSGLELTVDLPGVEEKDVTVQVVNDLLTISGHVSFEPDREERNYRLIERDYGFFSRSIDLPEGVPHDKIRACLRYGVLTVTIPNPATAEPKVIEVQSDPIHLTETGDGFELALDAPGFREDEMEILARGRRLTIRGERRPGSSARALRGDGAGREASAFSRSVELPLGADAEQIRASLSQGVLTVKIPAAAGLEARKIEVRAAA